MVYMTADKNTTNALDFTGGKLFSNMRDNEFATIGQANYEGMLPFLRFLDKYVSKMVGRRELNNYFKNNRDKTLLDKVTSSDIAYTILLCENGVDVWDENQKIKATCSTDEEKKNYVREAVQKYHVKRGVKMTLYGDGWTKDGKDYHGEIEQSLIKLRNNSELWELLEGHWVDYTKENSRHFYEISSASRVDKGGKDDEDDEEDDEEDGDEILLPGDPGYNTNIGHVSGNSNNGGDE